MWLGTVSKEELTQFLFESGLDTDVFETAFENLDHSDGSADGSVNTQDLVTEFMRIVNLLKQGVPIDELDEMKIELPMVKLFNCAMLP